MYTVVIIHYAPVVTCHWEEGEVTGLAISSSILPKYPNHPLITSPQKPQMLLLQWNYVSLLLAANKVLSKE